MPDTEEQLRHLLTGMSGQARERHPHPHMAWFSKEALERILDTTASNIQGFLTGLPPTWLQRPWDGSELNA